MDAARRALVVEDDEGIATLWALALEDDGFVVQRSASALGVPALVRRWRPEVILLDLGLPFRSGASLLVDLKGDPETAAVPVVIVSAAPDALPPGYRALTAAILTKPLSPAELSAAVATVLARAATLRRQKECP